MDWLTECSPAKIAVLRALNLGDLLCITPAMRALRAALPSARFTLVGLPWARAWVQRLGFDAFIELPGFPGLRETLPRVDEMPAFIERMQAERFDLALQMHGNGSITNSLITLFEARHNAGFRTREGFAPALSTFFIYPEQVPEPWRWLELTEGLGAPARGDELAFEVTGNDFIRLRDALGELPAAPYACLHPGAREDFRRWPAAYFARVGDELATRGLRVLITGSADESSLTASVASLMDAPSLDLGGRTDLGACAALLKNASLLVCNDTGVSHLAAALRTPSVVVFTRAETQGWPPLDRNRHRCVSRLHGPLPSDAVEQADLLLERTPHEADAHLYLARSRKLPLVSRAFPA